MEVLISTFVLSMGLLGVAALLPVGRSALSEAQRSDHAGALGRAAMREIEARRMLDCSIWAWSSVFPTPGGGRAFVIDPLGFIALQNATRVPTDPQYMGGLQRANSGFLLQRYTLAYRRRGPTTPLPLLTLAERQRRGVLDPQKFDPTADEIFLAHDDVQFAIPPTATERPRNETPLAANADNSLGAYSWFMTVVPDPAQANLPIADVTSFTVSVAVCLNRKYTLVNSGGDTPGEVAIVTSSTLNTPAGRDMGTCRFDPPAGAGVPYASLYGGTVILAPPRPDPSDPDRKSERIGSVLRNLRADQWILLYTVPDTANPTYPVQCHWYRILAAAVDDNRTPLNLADDTTALTIVGPTWTVISDQRVNAIIIDKVIGVYTTQINYQPNLSWGM